MSQIISVPEIFGSDVFNEAIMQQRLEPDTYNAWKHCFLTDSSLPPEVVTQIAVAMTTE